MLDLHGGRAKMSGNALYYSELPNLKLLNRSTRSVSLTPDGEVFLQYTKRMLADMNDARNALSHNQSALKGRLRVTASSTFGRLHIVPYVAEFLGKHPELQLELNLTDQVVDIVREGYDLAFRLGTLEPSSLLAQRISDDPHKLVASPKYLEKYGAPQTPKDLLSHNCLPIGHQNEWQFLDAQNREHLVQVSGNLQTNLGDAIADWTLAGLGIARASLWHAAPSLESGALVELLSDYRIIPEASIWAVRPPGRLMHARVKAFIDFMREKIKFIA